MPNFMFRFKRTKKHVAPSTKSMF
ncbi:hypothetical protein M8C21_013468 [Ambrosia artemisiifolia]|uniref:Uncharacterized protein n=1 Tax=Ambrosia artemisiifolia TaxID=4212 RepID=A0AAD5D748_AMBAR|nr:hypothetical protein M8C21_013468 [Ambrosia artemisiifolia]